MRWGADAEKDIQKIPGAGNLTASWFRSRTHPSWENEEFYTPAGVRWPEYPVTGYLAGGSSVTYGKNIPWTALFRLHDGPPIRWDEAYRSGRFPQVSVFAADSSVPGKGLGPLLSSEDPFRPSEGIESCGTRCCRFVSCARLDAPIFSSGSGFRRPNGDRSARLNPERALSSAFAAGTRKILKSVQDRPRAFSVDIATNGELAFVGRLRATNRRTDARSLRGDGDASEMAGWSRGSSQAAASSCGPSARRAPTGCHAYFALTQSRTRCCRGDDGL